MLIEILHSILLTGVWDTLKVGVTVDIPITLADRQEYNDEKRSSKEAVYDQ
jgi:hypothetical protein